MGKPDERVSPNQVTGFAVIGPSLPERMPRIKVGYIEQNIAKLNPEVSDHKD